MYIELEVRRMNGEGWHEQAIDSRLIEVVRPCCGSEGPGSLIYDQDDVLMWQCKMPYRQLLDKLNGLEDEKVDVGVNYRMDITPAGEPLAWYPVANCGRKSTYPVSIEARFVGGFIDAESVRVVK